MIDTGFAVFQIHHLGWQLEPRITECTDMRVSCLKGSLSLSPHFKSYISHPPPWETVNLSVGKQHLSSLPIHSPSLLKRSVLSSTHGCIDFTVMFLKSPSFSAQDQRSVTDLQLLSVDCHFSTISFSSWFPSTLPQSSHCLIYIICYWQNSQ